MNRSERKVMSSIAYYSLSFVLIAFAVLFMVLINNRTLAGYQAIVYNIWAALLIIVVLFDILATLTGRGKLVVGFAVYGLAVLFLIMAFIVFANLSVGGVIVAANLEVFSILVYFSLALTVLLAHTYCLGMHSSSISYDGE